MLMITSHMLADVQSNWLELGWHSPVAAQYFPVDRINPPSSNSLQMSYQQCSHACISLLLAFLLLSTVVMCS